MSRSQRAFVISSLLQSCFKRTYSQGENFDRFLTAAHFKETLRKFQSIKVPQEWKKLETHASVLIPLCHVENEVCLLYTMRKLGLRRHSGQVSFPGGMQNELECAEMTAVRETEEEIGIPERQIEIHGRGSPVARQDVLITPVIGYVGHVIPSQLKLCEQEVEYAFALPLVKFCDVENCRFTRFRNSFTIPVFLINGHRVWGITAYITHTFLKCFLGDVYKFTLR